MKQNLQQRNRHLYMDILRVMACLSVVMIHTGGSYRSQPVGSGLFWLGILSEGLARLAVPVFAMLSGALMLDENYAFSLKKCKSHIIKMVLFFFFWSFVYCLGYQALYPLLKQQPFDLMVFLKALIQGHYHLWFIPMVIGFYLLLPLLRLWVKEENRKYVRYFLILFYLFSCVLPHIAKVLPLFGQDFSLLWTFPEGLQLDYVGGLTGYFILGWYLNTAQPKKLSKPLLWFGAAGFLFLMVLITAAVSYMCDSYVSAFDNHSAVLPLYSGFVFLLVKAYFQATPYNNKFSHKIIAFLCDHSLCIYGVHVAMITVAYNILPSHMGILHFTGIYLVSVLLSVSAAALLRKLPLLKKIL